MIVRLILIAAVVLCASCSTYQLHFAKAVQAAPVPPDGPTGPWKGRWVSEVNGHQGALWCIITPAPNGDCSGPRGSQIAIGKTADLIIGAQTRTGRADRST